MALSGKRRYDRKQSGYGGQTKPVFHKKVRTSCEAHSHIASLTNLVPGTSECSWLCIFSVPALTHVIAPAGQDHKEDCPEIAMPGLQSCAHARTQGVPSLPFFLVCELTWPQIVQYTSDPIQTRHCHQPMLLTSLISAATCSPYGI